MTDRLDRIEALQLASEKRQAKRDEEIDTLLGAVATTEANVRRTEALVNRVTAKAEGNELICDTIRAEARADRLETRQLWNDAVTQMQNDRDEWRLRVEDIQAKADARYAAQMEVIQTLLLELTKSNGNINSVNTNVNQLRDRVDGLEKAS